MAIMNWRNALVGWAAIKLGKKVAKKKASDLVPGTADDSKVPNKPAILVALAGLGGAVLFWRKRSGGGASDAE